MLVSPSSTGLMLIVRLHLPRSSRHRERRSSTHGQTRAKATTASRSVHGPGIHGRDRQHRRWPLHGRPCRRSLASSDVMAAFVGMANEIRRYGLAVKCRQERRYCRRPMYRIENGLGKKYVLFAFFGVSAVFFGIGTCAGQSPSLNDKARRDESIPSGQYTAIVLTIFSQPPSPSAAPVHHASVWQVASKIVPG